MGENKSKLGLEILIGVLVLLIVGLSVFIIYDKVLSSNNDNINNNGESNGTIESSEEKVVDLSLDSTIVKSLAHTFYKKYNTSEFDYADYFYKNDKTIISSIPNDLKIFMVITNLNEPRIISYDDFNKEYKSIFGNTLSYNFDKFDYYCKSYYKNDTGKYYYSQSYEGCGGAICGGTNAKLAYAKQTTTTKENKIEIYEYFYNIVCVDNGVNIYSDYNKTNLIKSDSYSTNTTADEIFSNYADKLGMYKYTFIEDSNGIFVFTSVEKVK